MIDKKKLRKIVIILLSIAVIIAIILLGRRALSRYQSDAQSSADVDVAFFLVKDSTQEEELYLSDIEPGVPKTCNIEISNNNGTLRSETAIEYNLTLETTTYMPLDIDLYWVTEEDGVEIKTKCKKIEAIISPTGKEITKTIQFFKNTTSDYFELGCNEDETAKFILEASLPEELPNNMENAQFSDLIDYIKIKLDARQKI